MKTNVWAGECQTCHLGPSARSKCQHQGANIFLESAYSFSHGSVKSDGMFER